MGEIKTDSRGLVCQPNKKGLEEEMGGGDSLAWTSHMLYLQNKTEYNEWWHTHFNSAYKGNFLRHPNPKQTKYGFGSWSGGHWTGVISRDQLTPALCYMAKCKDHTGLWNTFKAHGRRGWLFSNNVIKNNVDPKTASRKLPDLTLFDIWALYLRGFRAWPLYPLLCIFDLHLLLTAITKYNSKSSDIISFVIKVITAQEILPTPLGWLASKISTRGSILKRIANYWCGWRDQCGMYDLYKPYVRKYWRN